uniref:Uncharacterized protein n=1 Tax=uncultured marine group II/III euryarchaeote KM3_156_A06 TaxID=1457899 RepID=A0A075GGD0_9EURY|nr:hypothetical protein [uncultured marine group II/III euryarchaeote KM3_156_A06]
MIKSNAAKGVKSNHPKKDDHATIAMVDGLSSMSSDSKICLIKLVETAQLAAAHIIKKSPTNLWFIGISVFGLQPVTIPTPARPTINPKTRFLLNFLCNRGMASSAVNAGLNVIRIDASPAAVLAIPCMKNN